LLESINLQLQLAASAIRVWLLRIAFLAPAVVHRLTDTVLAADVRNSQSFGQIALGFLEEMRDLVGGPSPSHRSLRGLLYSKSPLTAGPVFGEQVSLFFLPSWVPYRSLFTNPGTLIVARLRWPPDKSFALP